VLHADDRFHSAVESAVDRLETATDAEIVVVAAPRSGSYRDVSYGIASIAALVAFLIVLAVPVDFFPWVVPLELALVWAATGWLVSGNRILRWLVPASRKRAQVEEAAHAEFHRESVHATPHRTGVLIYVSAMEGQVEVVPDLGIEGRIPKVPWKEACEAFSHDDMEHFLAGLDALGALLAEHVPPLETDLVDLPNAPRIRS